MKNSKRCSLDSIRSVCCAPLCSLVRNAEHGVFCRSFDDALYRIFWKDGVFKSFDCVSEKKILTGRRSVSSGTQMWMSSERCRRRVSSESRVDRLPVISSCHLWCGRALSSKFGAWHLKGSLWNPDGAGSVVRIRFDSSF